MKKVNSSSGHRFLLLYWAMKHYLLLLVFLFIAVSTFAQAPVDIARVDQIVAADMTEKHTPAVQIAIVQDGRMVYSKAFGIVDLENDIRATTETVFRTASIAKPLTAVATLTLADAGKLDLDAPVQTYCSQFPLKPWSITTRELLSHTSGIRHYKGDNEIESTRHYPSMSDAFAIFANDQLLFEPGTNFSYTTYGYTVVGCVIEGASHQTYFDYLRQHVLQPASMTHTVVDDVFNIIPHRARGYQKVDGQLKNSGLTDTSYKIPAGGLVSTAEDYVHLDLALMNGQILKPGTIEEMWTIVQPRSVVPSAEGKFTYGLGWEIAFSNGHKIVSHTGSQQGCNTAMAAVPDEHFAVAVMTNMQGGRPTDIVNKVLELFAGVTTARPKS